MKIGYLCSDVDVQLLGYEGCSVHIREFTNALFDNGHDVFIICNWLGDPARIQTKARVYQLKPQGQNKVLWETLAEDPAIINHFLDRDVGSILWNTWLQAEGAAIMEREKPDFIYERYALFGFGGLELARRLGIPLILELNAPLCDQQDGYQRFPLTHTARRLEPRIICQADAVVALTNWLADWAVELGADREKIHVLPDAVSYRLFGGNLDQHAVRHHLELGSMQVVGFVGGFHKWHDVSGLIDAFLQLYRANPERRLLLVGDGQARKTLEQKVRHLGLSEAVRFTGKIPHEEVPQYIAAMNVAVVPYQPIDDFFFSPMKLFEYMAVGCPTVAADLGQISEVIEHGRTGWLYPAGDNAKLAEGIAALLENRELASEMGKTARKHVLSHYTWEEVTRRVVRIAETLIDDQTNRAPSVMNPIS